MSFTYVTNNLWKIGFGAFVGFVGIGKVFFNGSFLPSALAGAICAYAFPRILQASLPLSYQSQLDPTKTVDMNNWAVTLLNSDDDKTSGLWGHAQIAVEGVTTDNLKVTYLAHLTVKQGVVLHEKFGMFKIEYIEKSNTFLRTKEKVKKILRSIKLEEGSKINLTFTGRKYVKSDDCMMPWDFVVESYKEIKYDNCIIWALHHLEDADIELHQKSISFIPYITPRQFTSENICAIQ